MTFIIDMTLVLRDGSFGVRYGPLQKGTIGVNGGSEHGSPTRYDDTESAELSRAILMSGSRLVVVSDRR
ncbi:MAG: hypothetical protein ACRYGR_02085 [Janthinobacterium lividum]